MVKDRRLGQTAKGPPQLLRDSRMQLSVTANMKFVDHRLIPRRPGRTIVTPGEGGINNPTARRKCHAVSFIKCQIVARLELVTK
jgi:hypothetical protein